MKFNGTKAKFLLYLQKEMPTYGIQNLKNEVE